MNNVTNSLGQVIDVYTMPMHSVGIVENGSLFTTVMRVPGGWIYRSYDKSHNILSAVFVPYKGA